MNTRDRIDKLSEAKKIMSEVESYRISSSNHVLKSAMELVDIAIIAEGEEQRSILEGKISEARLLLFEAFEISDNNASEDDDSFISSHERDMISELYNKACMLCSRLRD